MIEALVFTLLCLALICLVWRLVILEKRLIQKESEKQGLKERLAHLQQMQAQLSDTFQALSYEALERNNRSFLELAKTALEKYQESARHELDKKERTISELFTPVKETLWKLEGQMHKLEKERKGDHESMSAHLRLLIEAERALRQETSQLAKALKGPGTRGRWGELQLRRIIELSGMVQHCDFFQQTGEATADGFLRPDLIVRLPGHRQVVIDAKVPLDAYLEAHQIEEESARGVKLREHAKQLRLHMSLLGKKSYWEHFQPTPEFVVLFLPGETFLGAALEEDPQLIEWGVEQGVILATPTTLIALLRTVAYGWKQQQLSLHVEKVSELGHELYKRIVDMGSHWAKMGRSLSSVVEAYNRAVGSLENRVLATARKFQQLGAAAETKEIEPLESLQEIPRKLQASEFESEASS